MRLRVLDTWRMTMETYIRAREMLVARFSEWAEHYTGTQLLPGAFDDCMPIEPNQLALDGPFSEMKLCEAWSSTPALAWRARVLSTGEEWSVFYEAFSTFAQRHGADNIELYDASFVLLSTPLGHLVQSLMGFLAMLEDE